MTTQTQPSPLVAGVGELLWDVFPHHRQLGGAPTNFAWQCQQLGVRAYPVSCVGQDALGHRALRELQQMGVDTRYVFTSADHPTGTVAVTLDARGHPSYEIHADVAWDHVPYREELHALAPQLDAVCFGTLAQRSPITRRTLRTLLETMRPSAWRVLDVNLRQDFHSAELLTESLQRANVLKLSDEELPVLADYFDLPAGSDRTRLDALRARFDLRLVALTRGADGSLLVRDDQAIDFPGKPILAVDSVGAGDAFTAALTMGLLQQRTLLDITRFANDVAAFVCSQSGATPVLPENLTSHLHSASLSH